MSNSELEINYLRTREAILNKIKQAKDKWLAAWEEVQGSPAAEKLLIPFNLEIRLLEAQAIKELKELEEEVKAATSKLDQKGENDL